LRRRGAPLVAACALALASAALAAYPERAVKLIVPWPPGGDTDAVVRPFAAELGKHLGGSVVVTNVAGATGTVGAHEAKTAPADGYTLLAVNDAIHAAYYTGVGDVAP
jgi:tripartite-type tricarboxylate transporter receptor subunit TctC